MVTALSGVSLFLVSATTVVILLLLTIVRRRASLTFNLDLRRVVFLLLVVTALALLRKCTYGQDAKHHDHQ